jgi:hypothetical protein
MGYARKALVSLANMPYYHCVSRCVRPACCGASSSPGATRYELQGRFYSGPNTTISWTLPQSVADFSIEYYVRACDANGCSGWQGPAYAQ